MYYGIIKTERDTMKTITVKFEDGYNTSKTYDYLVDNSTEVHAGDYAIAHNGSDLRITRVIDVSGKMSTKATKTVVKIINKTDFNNYFAANEAISERKKLVQKLDTILAQENEMDRYRLLAERNPEAADILKQLGIN